MAASRIFPVIVFMTSLIEVYSNYMRAIEILYNKACPGYRPEKKRAASTNVARALGVTGWYDFIYICVENREIRKLQAPSGRAAVYTDTRQYIWIQNLGLPEAECETKAKFIIFI